MKTIKIIDLLNKIANGEEVPKKIKIKEYEYIFADKLYARYFDEDDYFTLSDDFNIECILNDEVEILEEKKEDKLITKESIEALGYACGEIKKLFESGWNKSIENKPLEEEKKIPEKLLGEPRHIYNENELYIVGKVNEIIDYIESKEKGE